MLDCLHEASPPSRRWPAPREGASLLAGVIRARGRARVGSSSGDVWASGLRIGAFLALGIQMALCVQRWNYDWSHRAVFLTDKPQSQLMNLVWTAALIAALPLGRRVRLAAAWAAAVMACLTALYSFPEQFPSPFFVNGVWRLLPLVAGLVVPAVLVVHLRRGLESHNRWTLPMALVAPVPVALGVVVADAGTIDVVQVIPYVVLITIAVALAPLDPRLAIACTVAVLPLALLELGQELRSGVLPWAYSVANVEATEILTAVAPFIILAGVSFSRARAWQRLHSP